MSDKPKDKSSGKPIARNRTPNEAKKRIKLEGPARHTPERLKTKGRKLTPSSKAWPGAAIVGPLCSARQARGLAFARGVQADGDRRKNRSAASGIRVVDLGAAPGGWSQLALKKGAKAIVGIDLLVMEPIPGVELIQGDFLDEAAPELILAKLGGKPDLVLSDMAADTTGHRSTDHIRTAALFELAADFALEHVAIGGAFCGKVFQGGAEADILARLKQGFAKVRHMKPPASRKESPELFVIAQGRR